MSTRGSRGVGFRPSTDDEATIHKQSSTKRASSNSRSFAGNCTFRLPRRSELSPLRLLKHLREKVAASLHLVSRRRRSSPKVSSSAKSRTLIAPVDTQRSEAIDDCIKFINSSSSLPRSTSAPAIHH